MTTKEIMIIKHQNAIEHLKQSSPRGEAIFHRVIARHQREIDKLKKEISNG